MITGTFFYATMLLKILGVGKIPAIVSKKAQQCIKFAGSAQMNELTLLCLCQKCQQS
jgi:hypothetical protein